MFVDCETLAAQVRDGDVVALPFAFSPDFSAAAMAVTRALVLRGARHLHLVGVPSLSLQADLLIGAGCVDVVESGSVLLYEHGPAQRFLAACRSGRLEVRDSTCPAIHAALIAGEKGLPFMPVRGLIGSDILRLRSGQGGWRVVDNPFGEDDPIVLVPALRPDVALFHAPLADRHGNVWIGRRSELLTIAKSAHKVLVTFEAFHDGDLAESDAMAAGMLPAVVPTLLSHQPRGSWPLHGGPAVPEDAAHLAEYARLARTDAGFAEYLDRHVRPGVRPEPVPAEAA